MALAYPVPTLAAPANGAATVTQHTVSIGAIADQTAVTGTINCVATPSGGSGTYTYAWSGEKPDGASASFADATAASTTITLSAATVPGNYAIRVVCTDSETGLVASAVAYFRVGGDITEGVRAVELRVVGGALVGQEQALVGDVWMDIGSSVAATVETDGGVTFSGTTATLPTGIASSTAPNSAADKRHVAFTSFSATFQALLATGAMWTLVLSETGMDTTLNARWGGALTSAAGSFDAATENNSAVRTGHNGVNWSHDAANGNTSWAERSSGASLGRRFVRGAIGWSGCAQHFAHGSTWTNAVPGGSNTSTPTRLYWLGGAKTAATLADTVVTDPRIRIEFRAAAL